jgi:hypothetical protein
VKRRLVSDRYVAQVVRMHDDLRAIGLPRLPPSPVSLYMYLTSCPMLLRVPGVIAAGRAALSEALEWEIDEFDAAVAPLVEHEIVAADWRARLVFLPLVLAAEPSRPTSPSVVAMWRRELTSIPPCDLRDRVIAEVAAVVKATNPVWATAFETGCDPQRGRPKPRVNQGGNQGGKPGWSPGCEPSVSDSVPIPNRTSTENHNQHLSAASQAGPLFAADGEGVSQKPSKGELQKKLRIHTEGALELYRTLWMDRHQPADGKPPVITRAGEKQLKDLIRAHGAELVRGWIRTFLDDDTAFLVKRAHDLALLAGQINSYRATTSGTNGRTVPMAPAEFGGDLEFGRDS